MHKTLLSTSLVSFCLLATNACTADDAIQPHLQDQATGSVGPNGMSTSQTPHQLNQRFHVSHYNSGHSNSSNVYGYGYGHCASGHVPAYAYQSQVWTHYHVGPNMAHYSYYPYRGLIDTPVYADTYTYHFGPGIGRHVGIGHYRFPYYSYRRPWYYPGPAFYNRNSDLVW